jgi:RNA polymerase sigma factor for flagellar operon FliA
LVPVRDRRGREEDVVAEDANRALWVEYRATGAPELREELILRYAPLVRYVAAKVGSTLPANVDSADLVSYGMFGLIDVIDKYDLNRPNKFETYAIQRIRGAIIDELRALDWVPRSLRSRSRDIDRATSELEATLRRKPTAEELAEHIGVSVHELHQVQGRVAQSHMVALEELNHASPDSSSDAGMLGDMLEDSSVADPASTLEDSRLRTVVANAIGGLDERDKMIVTLYYYEQKTLAEIGKIFGVTESRICQIHTKAIMRLRDNMSAVAA